MGGITQRWYSHESPPTGWYWTNTGTSRKEVWTPVFYEDVEFGKEFYLNDRDCDWKWVVATVGPIPKP